MSRVQITNDAAHELALTIINDGARYRDRCELARRAAEKLTPSMQRAVAHSWLEHASQGATAYEKQFGSPGASSFTATDILEAAVELAAYYERHVKEF